MQPSFAALVDVALAVCIGGLLLRTFLGDVMLKLVMRIGLIALLVGLLGSLWSATASMSGGGDVATVWQALPEVLTRTTIGAAASLACLAWCAIVATFVLRRRIASWAKLAWCALAVVCIARAASGHANDAGWAGSAVWIHAVHIAAGSIWAGTVFLAAGLALSWRNWDGLRRQVFAQRISQAATFALTAVAVSGFLNAWRMLGDVGISLRDAYTALLAAKLACVCLAVCLGAYNRWRVMPVLMEKGAATRFAAVLAVEGGVLLVAMLLAAELGTMMPPM